MKMSLNAVLVPLALVLVLKCSSAVTSAGSTATDEATSAHSATDVAKELEHCIETRQCDAATCSECQPGDKICEEIICRDKCECACAGYRREGMDRDLWHKCKQERECDKEKTQCIDSCSWFHSDSENPQDPENTENPEEVEETEAWFAELDVEEELQKVGKEDECKAKCELHHKMCGCECLRLTRDQARMAITATTTCSSAGEAEENLNSRCIQKCYTETARDTFGRECGDGGSQCEEERMWKCECGCAGLLAGSATHYDLTDKSRKCISGCERRFVSCSRGFRATQTEHERWCKEYSVQCKCKCFQEAGATSSTGDRAALELCAYVRSCHNATCECREEDAECVSQCRDSCRCGCIDFPAAGPGERPAGGLLTTVSQCRDKADACLASCTTWDGQRREACYMEREMCGCKCAGRSTGPPSPTDTGKKKIVTIPTDTGDKKIVMHCNYLS